MKYLIAIIAIVIISGFTKNVVAQCDDQLIEVCYPEIGDFKFLKHYPVRFKKSKKEAPLTGKNVLVLNQDTKYKIVVCNASDYDGQLVFQLYQSSTNSLVGTTYDPGTKKGLKGFEFICRASGIYYLTYYFLDGKEGCAVIMTSEKQN